jgi:hypothetical protein
MWTAAGPSRRPAIPGLHLAGWYKLFLKDDRTQQYANRRRIAVFFLLKNLECERAYRLGPHPSAEWNSRRVGSPHDVECIGGRCITESRYLEPNAGGRQLGDRPPEPMLGASGSSRGLGSHTIERWG